MTRAITINNNKLTWAPDNGSRQNNNKALELA